MNILEECNKVFSQWSGAISSSGILYYAKWISGKEYIVSYRADLSIKFPWTICVDNGKAVVGIGCMSTPIKVIYLIEQIEGGSIKI